MVINFYIKVFCLHVGIILIFLMHGIKCDSQNINGLYKDIYNNKILIEKDSLITIEMPLSDSINTNTLFVYGSFKKKKKHLEIRTKKNENIPDSYYKIVSKKTLGDTCALTIADTSGNLLSEYSVIQYNKNGRYIKGYYLHEPQLTFKRINDAEILYVGKSGYMVLNVPLDSIVGKRINIILFPGIKYLENENYKLIYKLKNDSIILGPLIPKRTPHEYTKYIFQRIRTRLNQLPWRWFTSIRDDETLFIDVRKINN